MFSAIILKAR